MKHEPVLAREAQDALAIQSAGIYVDATFGRGGHSRLILERLGPDGRLIVFDKDPEAIRVAEALAAEDPRVTVVHSGFKNLVPKLTALGMTEIDGILFDFGLSSPQVDDAARGFSFRADGPLDMRMDNSAGETAAEWINRVAEEDLAAVLKDYGEERFSKKIARAIVNYRAERKIATTKELADIVSRVIKVKEREKHPATRTFQALRIVINQELKEIETVLPQAGRVLKNRGRLVAIAFHSLEDRLVKQFIQKNATPKRVPKWVMITDEEEREPPLVKMGRAIKPSDTEKKQNPRSRSAIMRVAMRTGSPWDDEA